MGIGTAITLKTNKQIKHLKTRICAYLLTATIPSFFTCNKKKAFLVMNLLQKFKTLGSSLAEIRNLHASKERMIHFP